MARPVPTFSAGPDWRACTELLGGKAGRLTSRRNGAPTGAWAGVSGALEGVESTQFVAAAAVPAARTTRITNTARAAAAVGRRIRDLRPRTGVFGLKVCSTFSPISRQATGGGDFRSCASWFRPYCFVGWLVRGCRGAHRPRRRRPGVTRSLSVADPRVAKLSRVEPRADSPALANGSGYKLGW
jgi:hypothetical protein